MVSAHLSARPQAGTGPRVALLCYTRAMRPCSSFLVVVMCSLACGGSRPSGKSTAPESAPQLSKGAQCLEHAQAPREPRPDAPESIRVAHILVRHRDLERPEGATRTREEACLRALEALEALKRGASWSETVKKYSDAPGPAEGSLGMVRRDDLEPAFADAAFGLDVDELSYVVETRRGFHIILRQE